MKIKNFISLFFIFLLSYSLYSQREYDNFFLNLKTLNFKKINTQKLSNKNLKNIYTLHRDNGNTYKKNVLDLLEKINTHDTITLFDKSLYHLSKGYVLGFYKNKRLTSFKHLNTALNYSEKISSTPLSKLILKNILNLHIKANLQRDTSYLKDLYKYRQKCTDQNDLLYFYSKAIILKSQTKTFIDDYQSFKKESEILFEKYDSLFNLKKHNNNLSFFYLIDKSNLLIRDNPLKANKILNKVLSSLNQDNYFKPYKYLIYSNISRTYLHLNEHLKGLKYIDSANLFRSVNDSLKNSIALNTYKSMHLAKLKMFDSAYHLSEQNRYIGYKYNFQKQTQEIDEYKLELHTEEKEKDNLKLKQKNQQNLNFLYGSLTILFLGGIIAYLNLKNAKRKRLLAEQQKEIEKQKSLTLIKEHEINTINAMIDGQEKERIRIAEDLHDNIGSVLATLKLHFENLKLNREKEHFNQDELYAKTEKLIDETYLKIRSIAHAKNAGVIANKGLLVAVKLMAEKISDANKITIHVLDFGLDKRLDNQLEITVFRIIQELITNIIKHANATEATINISLFDKNLNIIIEDNGQGFYYDKINLKEGIGISSIKTRINHLKGTFEVDSTINKGTSIIINLPV